MKTKQLLNQLDNFLMKIKIYRWCKVEDVKAHFYILLIAMYAATMLSYLLLNAIQSFAVGLLVSIVVMASRELINESGWSWKDIKNGLYGTIVGAVATFITILAHFFIKSFYVQF